MQLINIRAKRDVVRKRTPRSEVIWRGPSRLNGEPIVAILTGLDDSSKNPKTGHMVQLWILPADVAPHEAIKTGEDAAICGDCPRRPSVARENGLTVCYVAKRAFQAPRSVWASTYSRGTNKMRALSRLRGKALRFGAYGDPAALPVELVAELADAAGSWTGYTHSWRSRPELAAWLMASCDSPADATEARASGWRYFRADEDRDAVPAKGEVSCPAVSGRATCATCGLCRGNASGAKSVWIAAH